MLHQELTQKMRTGAKPHAITLRVNDTMKSYIDQLAEKHRRDVPDLLRIFIEDAIQDELKKSDLEPA